MKADRAYLLAAGNGTRAGGPKIWRGHEGRPMLERQIEFLLQLFVPENVAVSVQEPWIPKCRGIFPGILWVAVDPSASPLGSLQALIKAHPPETAAFMHHIDMPVWDREVFEALARRAAEEPDADAAIPVQGGRRGHPVLLQAAAVPALLALDPAKERLDHWLRSRRVAEAQVAFAGIHENRNE